MAKTWRYGRSAFSGFIIGIIFLLAVIILVGYVGHWYAVENNCFECKLGSGGNCGLIGSCDMGESILCWVPVCPVSITE